MKNEILSTFLDNYEKESDLIFNTKNTNGYWSNLSKIDNSELMNCIQKMTTRDSIKQTHSNLYDVIFSEKRAAGLELLDLNGSEIALDLGCMWGALTIPLAKMSKIVLGIDQTVESLKFSEKRAKEEKLENINFLCGNLRDIILPINTFDICVVNGVLEWVPELEPIVVKEYWDKNVKRNSLDNPGQIQTAFLKNIFNTLKSNASLYLAIENRYDYKMFFGTPDPHSGLKFATIIPKTVANLYSILFKKRKYTPWIYSFSEINNILTNVGFSEIKLYACWPDYRFPIYINLYKEKNVYFKPVSPRKDGKLNFKLIIRNRIEWILFKIFNFQFFAPSIIAIAKK